jgi:bifunctional DNase/RNase
MGYDILRDKKMMKPEMMRFVTGLAVLGGLLVILSIIGARHLEFGARPEYAPASSQAVKSDLHEAVVKEVIFGQDNSAIVLLEARSHEKPYLLMQVGSSEALAIDVALKKQTPPRPLTTDLVVHLAHALGGKVKRLVIDKFEGNVYYGTLFIADGQGKETTVDTRPSDGIGVALRAEAPIYIDGQVLDTVGRAGMEDEMKEGAPDVYEKTLREL